MSEAVHVDQTQTAIWDSELLELDLSGDPSTGFMWKRQAYVPMVAFSLRDSTGVLREIRSFPDTTLAPIAQTVKTAYLTKTPLNPQNPGALFNSVPQHIGYFGGLNRNKYRPTRWESYTEAATRTNYGMKPYDYGNIDAQGVFHTGGSLTEPKNGPYPLAYFDAVERPYQLAVRKSDPFTKYLLARQRSPGRFIDLGDAQLDLPPLNFNWYEIAYLWNSGIDTNYYEVRLMEACGQTGMRARESFMAGFFILEPGTDPTTKSWFKSWQTSNVVTPTMIDWINKNSELPPRTGGGVYHKFGLKAAPEILKTNPCHSGILFTITDKNGADVPITQDLLNGLFQYQMDLIARADVPLANGNLPP